jgi:hypothetical protein
MKRTLLALGILAGALTIATAPAQIVYSFENEDLHGFADDSDDPITAGKCFRSHRLA